MKNLFRNYVNSYWCPNSAFIRIYCSANVNSSLMKGLAEYQKANGKMPDRIFFYRFAFSHP